MDNPWVFLALKIAILVLLYGFIYKVIAMIIRDIRDKTSSHQVADSVDAESPVPIDSLGLVVEESLVEGLTRGCYFPVKRQVTIGRGLNNSMVLNDTFVSSEHARIFFRDKKLFVEDLNSKNGTFLDGKRVEKPVPLTEGALLKIGGVTFKAVRWENEGS